MIAATWRPFAGAGAVAQEPAAAETNRRLGIFRCGRDLIVGVVDGVATGEMMGMRLAGIDHAFTLRVRQDAGGQQTLR